jgi:hypothetical protein
MWTHSPWKLGAEIFLGLRVSLRATLRPWRRISNAMSSEKFDGGNGRILLHDEVEERPNVFAIVPLWENVSEEDIMTPGDVFKLMAKEGYKVSYFSVCYPRVH